MPLPNRTPESLLPRCDSKNPATTCRGITLNGRPCRRSLASPKYSPTAHRLSSSSRSSTTLRDHSGVLDVSALYCHQHMDQAQTAALDSAPLRGSNINPIQERISVDSLVARLGVASLTDLPHDARNTFNPNHRYPSKPAVADISQAPSRKPREKLKNDRSKRPGFWASLCCTNAADDDDYIEVVRHKRKPLEMQQREKPSHHRNQGQVTSKPPRANTKPSAPAPSKRPVPTDASTRPTAASSTASVPLQKPTRSELQPPRLDAQRTSSTPDTRYLLSFIPRNLSPQTTAALLSELSKPISDYDEAGYIYIFWLTDHETTPSETVAASLLPAPAQPPSQRRRQRRPSDVMSEFSYKPDSIANQSKRTIQLKIGRANNVRRRMAEWQRQCGNNVSLVRFYPYIPSSAEPSPTSEPTLGAALYPESSRAQHGRQRSESELVRKVPHAHRVERLVHIELAEQRVKKDCQACGREHREWFEVDATEDGVKAVDETIRRWVRWAETTEGLTSL